MEKQFWQQKWEKGETAFHETSVNPSLIKYSPELEVPAGGRWFVPLCGRTRDITWLLEQGFRVVGVELVAMAVEALFAELGLQPSITTSGKLRQYQAGKLEIFVGDIFDLTPQQLGPVDAIYDRAALVALPEAMRRDYAAKLIELAPAAGQLLLCFDYDQSTMPGPPFAVGAAEVQQHYAAHYRIELLRRKELPEKLKGVTPAYNNVWQLRPYPQK